MFDNLLTQYDSLIFLDVETTGLHSKQDEIIELGAVRISRKDGLLCTDQQIDMLVQLSAGKRLDSEITVLTGITQTDIDERGVSKSEVCSVLKELFGTGRPLVVAYNAQFDLCFLFFLLHLHGDATVLKNISMLDALTVYKDRRAYPHKLENALKEYKLTAERSHRAIDDAIATYELMQAIDSELSDLERYINTFGYNPKYGVSGPRISSVKYVPQPYNNTTKVYEK